MVNVVCRCGEKMRRHSGDVIACLSVITALVCIGVQIKGVLFC